MIIEDQRALSFVPFDHAGTTHVVTVSVAGLDEGMTAVGALVGLFLAMGLLMVDHVAKLRCLDVTL